MAKKADLLARAQELNLDVTEKNTIVEIEAAIATAGAVEAEQQIAVEEKADIETTKGAAKAGKRSEKSLREAEEKAEKEARKAAGDTSAQDPETEEVKKKGPRPVTRPLIERRGKNYRKLAEQVEKNKVYSLTEALDLATKTNPAKFDASVEVHVRLGVDPRQADDYQPIGTVRGE